MKFKIITLDYDDVFNDVDNFKDYLDNLDKIYKLKNKKIVKNVYVRVSSRGNGVHIKLELFKPISFMKLLVYRVFLGDDINRIRMDILRYPKNEVNRLWDAKIDLKSNKMYKAGKWVKL